MRERFPAGKAAVLAVLTILLAAAFSKWDMGGLLAEAAWRAWYLPPRVTVFHRSSHRSNGQRPASKERDPSYRRYQEDQEALLEYRALLKSLEGSELLEEGAWQQAGGETSPAFDSEAAGKGSAGGSLGRVAGRRFFSGRSFPESRYYLEQQLADYDFLMKHFYTVHPTAAAGRELMRADAFLEKDFSLKPGEDTGPQILIYHTHSQEEYADYREGRKGGTIVEVGEYLAECLRKRGYRVLHDTSVYDLREGVLDRSKAYTYAAEGISAILQKNPSIQVILDLHRDGVPADTRLVTEADGKKMAKIMFFNGTSETPDGPIEYLKNPCREENLAFSFQMKLCADTAYPGLARKIYLKGLRYNQHFRPRSALIEVGAQTNTSEEAKNAMEPLADVIGMVLDSPG